MNVLVVLAAVPHPLDPATTYVASTRRAHGPSRRAPRAPTTRAASLAQRRGARSRTPNATSSEGWRWRCPSSKARWIRLAPCGARSCSPARRGSAASSAARSSASSTSKETRPSTRCSSTPTTRAIGTARPTRSARRAASTSSTGSRLLSTDGVTLLTIVADTCGRHDTIGGACSSESNTVRYGHHTRSMHSCRDSFLLAAARARHPAVEARHGPEHQLLHERPGHARRGASPSPTASPRGGKYVEMKAETDVLCLISNCPQLNNPCNAYNPTPIRVLVWDPGGVSA